MIRLFKPIVFVLFVAAALAVIDRERAPAQEKISISYPSIASTGGIVPWIAKERGFFTAAGVEAELIYTSGALSMQALIGGSVDLVLGSIFDPLSAIAGGADIVILGSFNNSPPYVMAARPDVRDVKDLRGKKIGVRSLTGPATAMTQILRVGGTAERLAALKEGLVDAALIDEAVAHRAKEAGLNVIPLKGVPHIHTGAYARRASVAQRQGALTGSLRAMRDAAVYMKNNRAGSIQVIQKVMKVSNPKVAETSYEILKDEVVGDPRVKNSDLAKALDLRLAAQVMQGTK